MQVKSELKLEQVWLSNVKIEPKDPDPRVVMNFRCGMSPEVADALGCRELVFAGTVPRAFVESMTLEGEEVNCEVHLSRESFAHKVLAKSVGKAKVHFEGTGPVLKFQVLLEGYAGFAADLAVEVKSDPVTMTLKPAQMELPLTAQAQAEEANEEQDKDVMREMGIVVEDEEEESH